MKKGLIWGSWVLLTLGLVAYFGLPLLPTEDVTQQKSREIFLMGETTSGHHQIELACSTCHTSPFGGGEVLQNACVDCHGAELKEALDSHPKSKFTDPRNADRVAILDARYCVTCHREHRPDITHPMGVTLPDDFCFHCHRDIGKERPTHEGMAFDTCASAGCHNFHDNRALYEDFLVKNGNPHAAPGMQVPARNALTLFFEQHEQMAPLTLADADAPLEKQVQPAMGDWLASSHAKANVNCTGCHTPSTDAGVTSSDMADWVDAPSPEVCTDCHQPQVEGFQMGKHGMRLAQGLSPMTPAMARLPMHESAMDKALTCNSCHAPHRFDTGFAATEACTSCHNSDHVNAFELSAHASSGVTCATCHMPREIHANGKVVVQHNQNDNLRPNEKMLRSVCMNCHELAFAIDALADPQLIQNNFSGQPALHIRSIDMALERENKNPNREH